MLRDAERRWTIYVCPTHGVLLRDEVGHDSQPPYPAYHKACQSFVEKVEVVPADGLEAAEKERDAAAEVANLRWEIAAERDRLEGGVERLRAGAEVLRRS